ncbi:hypothetical protein [Clostridium thermarum]|uniref:hypothetical protein n=1 Tax=Clostridium thermarum TaxID=1716543 RepID=UPI0011225868|nr:hypothetical protein [Clostridium thermarum]
MVQIDKDILIHIEKHKVITIKQCQRIFYNTENGYNYAQRKLRDLELRGLLKSYQNSVTKEKVYYVQDKISAHDIYILDFYSKLFESGCKNIEIKKEPRYLKGMLRPDGFFKFEFDGYLYFILLEVDLTHFTGMSKFQLYEKLYRDGDLRKECCGTFPQIVVMGTGLTKYESNNFEVTYVPFDLSQSFNRVLGLIA